MKGRIGLSQSAVSVRQFFGQPAIIRLALSEGFLGRLLLRSIPGNAQGPHDFSFPVFEGRLGSRTPGDSSVGPGFHFFQVQLRHPGPDDLLLVLEGRTGVVAGEEVMVGFPENLPQAFPPEKLYVGGVPVNDTALEVLEINSIKKVSHQRMEEFVFLDQLRQVFLVRHFGGVAAQWNTLLLGHPAQARFGFIKSSLTDRNYPLGLYAMIYRQRRA
ncbi:MAG: hypothetical protein A2413_16025 [Treponema sp. RIFOXYC1_FULL_61_9]|nr:MAG: hypothetical protein A2413_16025 [Treponema sp. RIFOXYC1_FULL_61_9]